MVPKPEVSKELTCLWLRPGIELNPKVREMIDHTDSYRDVVLLAIPLPDSVEARAYWIPGTIIKSRLETRDRAAQRNSKPVAFPAEAATPPDKVVDLTKRMDANGRLEWDAPGGPWLILRIGHASNYPMTRPSPAAAVGLEADRLAKTGKPRVSGRYTFTTGKHFDALQINRAVFLSKDMALYPSGLLGPVTLKWIAQEEETHP